MIKTDTDLLKFLELKEGDIVSYNSFQCIVKVTKRKENNSYYLKSLCEDLNNQSLDRLLNTEYEILNPYVELGKCSCQNVSKILTCINCPLNLLCNYETEGLNLFNKLSEILDAKLDKNKDPDIYNVFENRLKKKIRKYDGHLYLKKGDLYEPTN